MLGVALAAAVGRIAFDVCPEFWFLIVYAGFLPLMGAVYCLSLPGKALTARRGLDCRFFKPYDTEWKGILFAALATNGPQYLTLNRYEITRAIATKDYMNLLPALGLAAGCWAVAFAAIAICCQQGFEPGEARDENDDETEGGSEKRTDDAPQRWSDIFSVRGRASRVEWFGVAFVFVLTFALPTALGVACAALEASKVGPAVAAFGVAFLCGCVGFFATLATSVRRLRDAGFSGRWLLWAFFPVVGWAVLAVLLFLCPGPSGENRYGAPPVPKSALATACWATFAWIPNVFSFEDVLTGGVASDETTTDASAASTDPNRRVSRSEYGKNLGQTCFWLTVAAVWTGCFVIWGGWFWLILAAVAALGTLGGLFGLAFLAPGRLRDVGYTGERWTRLLIPVVGWATLVRLLTAPGTPGPNRFGLRPLSVAELKAAEEAERRAKREEKRRAESGGSSGGCVGTVGDSEKDDERETEREEVETVADAENVDDTFESGFGDGFWSFFSSFGGGGDGDSDGGWLDFFDGDCGDGGDGD